MRNKRGIKEKEKELSSPFGWNMEWGRGKSYSRERKSNLSLDFSAFRPSVLVEPRSKVVLCGKGYAWAPILGSFDNFRR